MVKKRCARCKAEKPYSEFHKNRGRRPDGHHSYCKRCLLAYQKTRTVKWHDSTVRYWLRHATARQLYEALVEAQDREHDEAIGRTKDGMIDAHYKAGLEKAGRFLMRVARQEVAES